MRNEIIKVSNDTILINDLDILFNVNGYIGGAMLSLCLVPQIIKTISTKSSKDISYMWQGFSIFGLILVESYGLYFGLMPVYIPVSVELLLMIFLTILKCKLEIQCKKKKDVEIEIPKINLKE